MKSFFGDLGRRIGETAETVSNKAGDAVEIQRLKTQVRSLERANEKDYMELGMKVYQQYKDNAPLDEESTRICEAIAARIENMERYEGQISGIRGDKICRGCGRTIDNGVTFCPYCGAKAEETAEEFYENAKEYAQEVKNQTMDFGEDMRKKAGQVAENLRNKAEQAAAEVKEKSQAMAANMKEKSEHAADVVKEKTEHAADVVKEKTEHVADAVKDKFRNEK
jgi:hypothetical protein